MHRVIDPPGVKMVSFRACRRRWIGAALLSLSASLASDLRAQARPTDEGAWKPRLSLGAAFHVSEPVHEFSPQLCPGYEVVLEGRAGWWIERRRGFVLSVARHAETEGRPCDSRRLVAPPDSGLVTYVDGGELQGYPHGSASVRMVLEAGPRSHGFIGVQWFWGKRILAPLVGLGGNYSIGGVTLFFEGQGSFLTLPVELWTAEFRGGQPVLMILQHGSRKRGHMTLRTGIDLPVGIGP